MRERKPVTPGVAVRLGKLLGDVPRPWVRMPAAHDYLARGPRGRHEPNPDARSGLRLTAGRHVIVPAEHSQPEERFLAIGKVAGRWATVVHTFREGQRRIISMRSARDAERRRSQELYGG